MKSTIQTPHIESAWNKGKLVGQKSPLKLKEIWATHTHTLRRTKATLIY